MRVNEDRKDLLVVGFGGLAFILVGMAALYIGTPSLVMTTVAIVSILFGLFGLIAAVLRSFGITIGPSAETLEARSAAKIRAKFKAAAKYPGTGALAAHPILSPKRQARVRRIVKIMTKHGIFAPDSPDPNLLFAGVADEGGPIGYDSILSAMAEVSYYHPDCAPDRWMANIVFLGAQVEQTAEYIQDQIQQIGAISNGVLKVTDIHVSAPFPKIGNSVPTDIHFTVNGEAASLNYNGAVKYLSTYVPHALAIRFSAQSAGYRLAWLWTDTGPFVTALRDDAVEALNSGLKLGARAPNRWEWIDQDEPYAAGD